MLRRSKRLKHDKERDSIIQLFRDNMNLFAESSCKKKIYYYGQVCHLFIEYNHIFMYDSYNNRREVKYDTNMREFLINANDNKEKFDDVFIKNNKISKRKSNEFLLTVNNTIQFIEKYLNKKNECLKKTILNDDVIKYIISFL